MPIKSNVSHNFPNIADSYSPLSSTWFNQIWQLLHLATTQYEKIVYNTDKFSSKYKKKFLKNDLCISLN